MPAKVKSRPENKDLSLGLTGIETLSSCNPKKNMELFTFYVYFHVEYK